MRRVLIALPLLLAACGDQGPDAVSQYRETVRCYNAAATYAQQFVVSSDPDATVKMIGYAGELKAKAFTLGGKLGSPAGTVAGDTRGAEDAAYIRKFFSFSDGTMTATDFGKGEIAHCNLDAVLQ